MPETLFGDAGQSLASAGNIAGGVAERAQEPAKIGAENARAAGSELGATQRQKMSGQDAQKLAQLKSQLDQAENMVQITPQIALGMVKNTGDKEWLKAVGTKMRSDTLLGLYQYGINREQARKSPKVTQIYDKDGKIRHAVVYTDENGSVQQLMLDEGITIENLNKGKGSGKGGTKSGGIPPEFRNEQAFKASYEKRRAEYGDPSRASQIKASNPQKYAEDQQFLKTYADQYDAILKKQSTGGQGGSASGQGGAPAEQKFDPDQFLNDLQGK